MKTLPKFLLTIIIVATFYALKIVLDKSESKIFSSKGRNKIESCGRFPQQKHIKVDNVVWQVLETPYGTVKLLNAYLDTRQNRTVVRVNANSMKMNTTMIFCQFWFNEDSPPRVVQASETVRMWIEQGKRLNFVSKILRHSKGIMNKFQFQVHFQNCHQTLFYNQKFFQVLFKQFFYFLEDNEDKFRSPYLIECPLNNNEKLPISLSLTSKPCDKAENNLKIINNQPIGGVKKKFGVCSNQKNYPNRSI